MYSDELLKRKIDYINNMPITQIRFNGGKYIGRDISGAHIVVKVIMNLFNPGFFNMDICEVIAELPNNQILIKRQTDNHMDIVDRKYVEIPIWQPYFETNPFWAL